MAVPTLAIRCPACGTDLRIVLAPAPPTQWFPCPHCGTPVPAVVPRDPPPLYSWEVLPGLYPPLPRPRVPRWRTRPAVAVALVAIVVSSFAVGGLLTYYGLGAAAPAEYTVAGTVEKEVGIGLWAPANATVVLTNDRGQTESQRASAQGTFEFLGVPAGGITLNATLPGYAPEVVQTFASPVYNTGTTGVLIMLSHGPVQNATTVSLTPFPNMESFLASIGGAIALLGLVAIIAGLVAVATVRRDAIPLGVVGGSAGLGVPFAIYLLGLGSVFPLVVVGAAIAGGFGAFVVTIRGAELAVSAPAAGPG
jgi:hypothetical protein